MEGAAMNNGTSDGEEKLWEKPWSLEEMRRGAQDWSLASDAGMLQYLQQFSQRLITRTHQIQEEVNGLLHETKMTGVRISNSFNDFIMLANTQFVENRVYDEDMTTENAEKNEKPSDKEKTKEEREAELIPRMTTAIRTGLQVIDTAFEKLDMNEANSDSDEEETPYKADPLLEAKDPYLARPLPYLIGSQAFFKDDDVGLVDVLSDEEEMSDHGSISESDSGEEEEEESVRGHPVSQQHHFSDSSSQYESEDSEGDLFGSVKQNEEELFDEEEGSSEEKEEISEKEPRDFAAELGAKINSRHTEKPADMPKKQKQKRKVSQEAAPFAVTPEEDDDLFAGKDSMFAPKQGLFSGGGGLFDDEDDDQGGMFPQETSKKSSGLPKPPPQRAAFSSDDESDSDEDDGPTEQMQPHKSSGVPASNKPYSQPPTHGGLFGGDEEEDLFASLSSAPAATKNASKVAAKPSPAAGLFGEEEADLFADESRLPPQRGAPKSIPQKTAVDLFMDDDDEEEGDLFADLGKTKSAPKSMQAVNKQEKKPEKKLPAGAVSMFGGAANPLLASLPSSHKVTPPSEEPEERSREQISPSKSDSLFGGSGDEDGGGDLFSVSTASPQVTDQKPSQVSRESSSLFGVSPESDSSGDMFSSTKATPERKLPAGAVSLFGGAPNPIVASMQKPSPAKSQAVEEVHAQKKEVSLFGGSGEEHQEDLFAAPQPSSKKAVPKKNKGPSEVKSDLFSDLSPPSAGDGLFGGATSSSGNKKSTKQPLSLFDDDDDDDDNDDDGSEHDQTETPTTKTKTKTVQDTGRKRSKSKSLFEDEDVLFGGPPPEDPGVDLFGPSSPIAKPPISIDKKTPTPFPVTGSPSSPAAKPAKKLPPGAVSMFGDSPNPLVDAINIRKPEQKLPPTEDAAEKTSPQQQVDEEDGLFSSKQPPLTPSITSPLTQPTAAPHTTPKKKMPPGAVSMFGGAPNPFMAARKTDEDHHTQEDEPTASEGEDLYSGDLTGTKLNRDLIAGTSSQGASSETEGTIGFDQPLKVDTLPTVVKNRAKIQNKRRPPTRKARVASTSGAGGDEDFPDSKGEEAGFLGDSLSSLPHHGHSVKSSSSTKHPATRVQLPVPIKPAHEDGENNDEDDLFSVSSVAPSVVSIDTPGNSDMRLPKDDLPSASDDFLEDKSKDPPAADYVQELPSGDSIMKRDIQPDSSSETTPKRHTSPVTSISPTQDDEDEDFFGASGLSNKPKPPPLEDEDLFNNSSLSSKPRSDPFEDDLFSSPVIHNALRTDDDLDIFGPSTSMPLPSQTLPPTDDDDLFGPVKIPPQPKPVVLGDHDIFGSSDALPSTKPALSDDDDIFSSSAKTILPKTNVDNTDDIFGSSNVPSKKNTANNDHDIFGNSNSQAPSADGDDIFGSSLRKTNEESQVQKKKETKVKKAQAPEIEDEDIFATSTPSSRSRPKKAATKDEDLFADDTDIFASIPKPTKTKTKHSKSKPADKSLFKDDTGDIFASASSKPKAKKSTKSKKSAAAIDKEPDIFDDPLSALQ